MATRELTHRPLAHRVAGETEVSLVWTRVGDVLTLELYDSRSNEVVELDVPREHALDAFRRPHAYLAAARARVRDDQLLAA
jgi:hypothetical protein